MSTGKELTPAEQRLAEILARIALRIATEEAAKPKETKPTTPTKAKAAKKDKRKTPTKKKKA
jgi:hypothetical protein